MKKAIKLETGDNVFADDVIKSLIKEYSDIDKQLKGMVLVLNLAAV